MGREEDDIRNIRENLAGMNRGPIAELWDTVVALWDLITDPGKVGRPRRSPSARWSTWSRRSTRCRTSYRSRDCSTMPAS